MMNPFTYGNLTPLGPPTTWVHIFLDDLKEVTEYGIRNALGEGRDATTGGFKILTYVLFDVIN
jgi:hypothetical protein